MEVEQSRHWSYFVSRMVVIDVLDMVYLHRKLHRKMVVLMTVKKNFLWKIIYYNVLTVDVSLVLYLYGCFIFIATSASLARSFLVDIIVVIDFSAKKKCLCGIRDNLVYITVR